MSDFGILAIVMSAVALILGHTAWQIRGIFLASSADAALLAHGELRYATVVSARQSGTFINDQPLCVVRLVDALPQATQREITQPIGIDFLSAIQAGSTVALRVDRTSGRALIDFFHSRSH